MHSGSRTAARRLIRRLSASARGGALETLTGAGGVRIAALRSAGPGVGVGLFVAHAASPGDVPLLYAMEKRALQAPALAARIDALPGGVQTRASRSGLLLAGVCPEGDAGEVVRVLVEGLALPALSSADMAEVRLAAAYEVAELRQKGDLLLPELAHGPALGGEGASVLDLPAVLERTSADDVLRFWLSLLPLGARAALLSAGCAASSLSSFLSAAVASLPPSPPIASDSMTPCASEFGSVNTAAPDSASSELSNHDAGSANHDPRHSDSLGSTASGRDARKCTDGPMGARGGASLPPAYVGGALYHADGSVPHVHVALALPGASHASPLSALAAQEALAALLGGGSAFSAGGPGKGMHSRLYAGVLNRHGWVESARAGAFPDAGLFVVHGSASPGRGRALASVLASQLVSAAERPPEQCELARAVNQAKSGRLAALESRLGEVDALGATLGAGHAYVCPRAYCAAMDAVTSADVSACARQMLSASRPTVVAYGPLDGVPSYDAVVRLLRGGH